MSEFLGEARVVIRPDTTQFAAQLRTQIATAIAKTPVIIPVTAQAAGGAAASTEAFAAAQTQAATATLGLVQGLELENQLLGKNAAILSAVTAAELEAAGVKRGQVTATAEASKATGELARIQALAVKSTNDLANAQLRTITAASEQGASQITAAAAVRTAAIAQEQLALAIKTGNVQLIEAALLTNILAGAHEAEALAALSATRAQNAHAASLANVQKAGIASGAGLIGLRGAVLTAGAGFIAATVAFQAAIQSIQSAAELEEEFNVFRVTAGATADEMTRVSKAAKQLGVDLTLPGVTARDAATAMLTLSKAGLSVQESIDGARGALALGVAAQTDFATSSELIAASLNTFRLNGRDAADVANLLAASANESQGSIEDMGLALKQAGAVAQLAGISIEDTLTILTQLSKAGLAGSDAGTSFRTALVRLIKPTEDVNEALAVLQVRLRDSTTGAIRPEVFGEIGEALKEIAPAQRQFIVAQLGGSDAVRAFGLAAQDGVAGFAEMNEAIVGTTAATDLAAARMEGFTGDLENLSNQASSLGTAIGGLVIPPLSLFVRELADAVRVANFAITEFQELAVQAREVGSAFADQIPFMDQAESHLGKIVGTAVKFQLLGPVVGAASLALDKFGSSAEDAAGKTSGFDAIIDSVTESIGGLTASLKNFQGSTRPTDTGLNVQQVLNRVMGFDSAETRARIRGSTEEILSLLEDEQTFLQAQLERDFVKRRPGLQRQLENALFGVVSDIRSIAQGKASDAKRAAADAKRAAKDAADAVQEADQAFLDLLGQRRDDAGRRVAAAGETEGVADDIRAQNTLQALIKIQIQKVKDRVTGEKERKAAIRELRIAIIASRQAEEQLREEQKKAAAEQRVTAILERGASLDLDIELADINENDKRRVALRRRRIEQLKREAKLLKLEGNALKENRNERARLRKEIEDIKNEDKDKGKSAQQFFFEQLQAQQGFASNLLGNLITGPTAGLVGVPSPTTQPGQGIRAASAAADGKAGGGPSAGQANTTNALLERILEQLKRANSANAAPEATHQRKVGAAAMDGSGNIHGIQG